MVSPSEEKRDDGVGLRDMVAAETVLLNAIEEHGEDSKQAKSARRNLQQVYMFAGVAEPL